MPVELEKINTEASSPQSPHILRWLAWLIFMLTASFAWALLFDANPVGEQSFRFWGTAIAIPVLLWGLMCGVRWLLYVGQKNVADGWNRAREEDIHRRKLVGRQSFQLLAVSTRTALEQWDGSAVGQQRPVLKTQPCRLHGQLSRHTQLIGDSTDLELLLLEHTSRVLMDLAEELGKFPADKPVTFLWEVDSELSENSLKKIRQEAWRRSGIRQSLVAVNGHGLAVLDHWLDERIDDQALLLIMAFHFAVENPSNTAEAVVGILLGNPSTQTTVSPVACLHRPERVAGLTDEAMCTAGRNALDWASLEAGSIADVWQVGVDPELKPMVSATLNGMSLTSEAKGHLHDLDNMLGHPGIASPWLGISLAAQAIQQGAGAQLIFSGVRPSGSDLWGVVLTPMQTT